MKNKRNKIVCEYGPEENRFYYFSNQEFNLVNSVLENYNLFFAKRPSIDKIIKNLLSMDIIRNSNLFKNVKIERTKVEKKILGIKADYFFVDESLT